MDKVKEEGEKKLSKVKQEGEKELIKIKEQQELMIKEAQKEEVILQQKISEKDLTHQGIIDRLKIEHDIKLKELKKEISVLQSAINKLTSDKSTLELEVMNYSRKSSAMESQARSIKSTVSIDHKSNIFGVLLKKTGGESNPFLKDAKKESKKTEEVLNVVWKDKIDDLKKLRENIVRMSPQTISTRSIPDDDYQNIDFDDEEAFKKMQDKLRDREFKHQEEKERLEKLRIEIEEEQK